MMYPRNAVFSLLIQLGDAPSVQGQNHGLLSVCSACLWSHGNEWRGRSASSPPELQKLIGGFHHQSTKEKCKAFLSTLVGWAVLLLPTVALQPCSASCEAALGWGIMHCSQLCFSMCRLARQSTRCRGWGFCRQLPIWKSGFAPQSAAGQSGLWRLQPWDLYLSGCAKSELAFEGALCFDAWGGRGTLGLLVTRKSADSNSVFILTYSVQNSPLYVEKCIWNQFTLCAGV